MYCTRSDCEYCVEESCTYGFIDFDDLYTDSTNHICGCVHFYGESYVHDIITNGGD